MIFDVMSRREAIAYAKETDILKTAVISITEPDDEGVAFSENSNIPYILRLHFWDSVEKSPYSIQPWQAEEIVMFVEKVKDEVEVIMVHCEAGQSRSAGVAAALMLWLNGNNDEIMKNRRYYPNMRCFQMVTEAIERRNITNKECQ